MIPIVFLPGIMGSNLRKRGLPEGTPNAKLKIAWRPDNAGESLSLYSADAATRQRQLNADATEVDVYDPTASPTHENRKSLDDRHDNINGSFIDYGLDTPRSPNLPLLMGDPPTVPNGRTKDQKTRERGWSEVFFDSYQQLLETCELRLNTAFFGGKLANEWLRVVGVDPSQWQAMPETDLQPLTEQELKEAVKGCWFPVHAMGYNWLQSNRKSAKQLAKRVTSLMREYSEKFECEKVIVVTHSMGGLVARALVHPKIGNLEASVLGIVHGVMPAMGAPAAYKRIRCGFDDSWHSIAPKVLGNYGDEVTAVLANSPGGLEMLPSQAYGNDWLQVVHEGKTIKSLPQHGDPYEEIYKLRGKWYGLLREEWINPAKVKDQPVGYKQTCEHLDAAKSFHNDIAGSYHPVSYAHYAADLANLSWRRVVWEVTKSENVKDLETTLIFNDSRQGAFRIAAPGTPMNRGAPSIYGVVALLPAADPGDRTVPAYSADDQLRSGKFKGVFRQNGYDHQDSYKNDNVLNSTLYCIVRISQGMTWSKA